MELHNKPVIISVGVDGWYAYGVDRLERSLIFHGYPGQTLLFRDYPPESPNHKDNPYAFKIAAFEEAIRRGFDLILWVDASFWAVKNPITLFDRLIDKGIIGFRSGYSCAQTCTNALLDHVGITRDEAEQLPEYASGMVGINLQNEKGQSVYNSWKEFCEAGLFKNSRTHDPKDSTDPRFLFGRQDQSAWSMALHQHGVVIESDDTVAYYGTNYNPDKLIFFIQGI